MKTKDVLVNKFSEELINLIPLSSYSQDIKFFETSNILFNNTIKFSYYDTFVIDSKKITEVFFKYNRMDLFIFLVEGQKSKGKGGTIGKQKVIFLSTNSKKGILSHEFGHSVLELGDEYSGDIPFLPSEKEVSKYKNLAIEKTNTEWEYIKKISGNKKISYYQGGMGRNKGIFHSYPVCLMKETDHPFCPICIYYSIIILNNITGQKVDFIQVIHQDMNMQKSPVPIIIHLQ